MDKTNAKAKIIITVVVLISTLAFVGLGTYAWYTISTKGIMQGIAVSMPRNGEEWPFEFIEQRDYDNWATIGQVMDAYERDSDDGWGKCITLGKVHYIDGDGNLAERTADDCYQLRPISTSDLETWYLPEYNGRGEVSYLEETDLDTVGNINRYQPTPSEEGEDIPSNYVYYYDLWVRTLSSKHDYELHLSNPLNGGQDVDADMYEEYNYGTFVLPGLIKDANGNTVMSQAGYDMSTCMRIGFAIYDTNPDDITDATVSEFYIYEPNCDARAKYFTGFVGTGTNYNLQKNYTYVLGNDNDNKKVSSHQELEDGVDYKTWLPYGEEGRTYQQFKDVDNKTVKQLQSRWKSDIDLDNLGPRGLDSTCIDWLGAFTSEATGNTALEGIDTPTFTTVTKGTPVHIRVYIWMEGQDVDCWNSSLAGSLKIGLEFRGDATDEEEPEPVIRE